MKIRRSRRHGQDNVGGEDSFLDIVANLVGVLIILVVVVGAKAGTKIQASVSDAEEGVAIAELQKQQDKTQRHARNLLKDNYELEDKILLEQQMTADRNDLRNRLLVHMVSVKKEIENRAQSLDENQKQAFQQAEKLVTLESQFRKLDSEYTALKAVNRREEAIKHYPTPIAKTVFSEEIHFRLRAGRIAYVPMTELTERMQDEWKEKARKLQIASETVETVGPVGDFRLQYHLQAEDRVSTTAYGEAKERFIEFTRFVMVPTREGIGVPLEKAIQRGTDFSNWIDLSVPEKTTVSIWVYPDSFNEFNQLKQWLYERGFKTACWPLSQNSPISGGPAGYRSTAQ
ncbi:MAG: hypothetical protein P8J33_18105 [Pirellulaceae bacterium]|nr:hypothetical protein [Pirellulaceae bacterium]